MGKEVIQQQNTSSIPGTDSWMRQQARGWIYDRFGVDESPANAHQKAFLTTVSSSEALQASAIPDVLATNGAFNQLVDTVLTPFQTRIGSIRFDEVNGQPRQVEKHMYPPIKFFQNGNEPYNFREQDATGNKKDPHEQEKDVFTQNIRQQVASYCGEFFDPTTESGFASENARKKFEAVSVLVPDIVQSLTSRDNYITMVQESQAADLVKAALHTVTHPGSPLTLRVGYGGSDDPFTSSRYPAYVIPSFRIADQINTSFDTFTKAKVAHREAEWGRKLTPDEIDDLRRDYGISDHPSRVQIAIAHEAAIGTGTKDGEKTRARTDENLGVLSDFVKNHFPHVDVEFMIDTPWNRLPEITHLAKDYKVELLKKGALTDPHINRPMEEVKRMGSKHGGEQGAQNALAYAANHDIYFGDVTDLPPVAYYQKSDPITGQPVTQNPDVLITIGGKPEKEFCAIRNFIREKASADDFLDYLIKRRTTLPSHAADSINPAIQETVAYLSSSKRVQNRERVRSALITEIGESPVYYLSDKERRVGPTVVLKPGESIEIAAIAREQQVLV